MTGTLSNNPEVVSSVEQIESGNGQLKLSNIQDNLINSVKSALSKSSKEYTNDLDNNIKQCFKLVGDVNKIDDKNISEDQKLDFLNKFVEHKYSKGLTNPRSLNTVLNILNNPGSFKDSFLFSCGSQNHKENIENDSTKENKNETKENKNETKENKNETKENKNETKENKNETKENKNETKENKNETKENKNEKFRTNIETTHPIIEKTKYLETYSQYLVDDQKVAQSDIAKSFLTISPDGTTWETMDAKYKDIAKFMYIAEQLGQKTPERITDQDRDVVNIANEFLSRVDMPTIQLPSKPKLENQETVYKSQELMDIDISESISQSQNQIGKENSQKEYQKLLDSQTITNKRYPDRQKDIQEKVLDEFWTKQTDIVRNILENAMPTKKEELQSINTISIDKGNLQINGKDADQWLGEKGLPTLGKENTDKIVSMLNQNLEKSGYLQYPSRLDKVVNDVVNKKTINACLKQIYKNFQNSGHNIDTRQTEVNLDNVNFGEEQIFMDVKIDGQSVKFAYNHQTGELVMEDFKYKIQGKNSSSEELKSGITIATLLNYDNLHSNVSGLAMEALGDLSDDLNQNSEKRFEDLPKNLNKEIDETKAYSNSLFADENDTVSYFLTQNTSAQNSATKILQSLPQQFNGENLEELGNVLKDKFRMLTSTESRQYEKTISNFCDMAKSLQNQPLGNYDLNYIFNKEVLKLVESKGNDLFLGVLKDLKPNELSKFLSFVEKEQQFPNSKDENSYSLNEEKIRETYDKFFVKEYIEKAEKQIMQMA